MNKHITMKNSAAGSVLSETSAPEFAPLDIDGWQGMSLDDLGLSFFIFNIEANAPEYPLHSAEDTWLAYVISGSGELHAGTDSGEKTQSVRYRAGDLITFHPDTPHGWKNDDSNSKILFAKSNG